MATLTKARSNRLFFLITGLFMAGAAVAMVKDQLYFLLLPLVIYIAMLSIFRMDSVALFCAFITPLSINLNKTALGIGVSLPADPIMFGLFLLFWFKVFVDGGLDRKVIRHPVTIFILLHLAWMVFTTFTSTLFVVSFKSMLARFCYVTVSYFMFLYIFMEYGKIKKFLWLYLSMLIAVIFYTLYIHSTWNWNEEGAHIAMVPFYNDHTSYAAAIAFFIPVVIAFISMKDNPPNVRTLSITVLVILAVAIVLSYTRASWVGLLGAFICWMAFVVRIKTVLVYGMVAAVALLFILFRTQLMMEL